jgi:hypothetical protein
LFFYSKIKSSSVFFRLISQFSLNNRPRRTEISQNFTAMVEALIRCLVISLTLLLSCVLGQVEEEDVTLSFVNCEFFNGGMNCDCKYNDDVNIML